MNPSGPAVMMPLPCDAALYVQVTGGCAAGMLFTHWIPGIFLYCWYFISAAGLVYITWNVFNKLWARLQKKVGLSLDALASSHSFISLKP
jgi:hypothetical protein